MKKVFLVACGLMFIYFSMQITESTKTQQVVAYRYGSKGSVVTTIQSKLKKWGYYNGTVDGKYGYKTYLAVKKFQRKIGIIPDGVAGNRVLNGLGIKAPQSKQAGVYNQNNNLLGRIITGEARGEPYIGQVAIGGVILNRTKDPRFPSTIPGVIYQPGAFTAVDDGQINLAPDPSCAKAANDALNGWDPSGGAIYYYNPATATSKWIWSRPRIKEIGEHVFCR